MNRILAKLIESTDGIVLRTEALDLVAHHVLDQAVKSGRLRRILPRTYLTPTAADDRSSVVRASLSYAGAAVALSHLTALEVWKLPVPPGSVIHLMTGEQRHLRGTPGVLVHRRACFTVEPPEVLTRDGMPVTRLETSIVDSWPLLDGDAKRAPAIVAVSERLTTPDRLTAALDAAPRLAGRRLFVDLIAKLAAGCRSPLELWGYDHVFAGPGMPQLRRQVPVEIDGRMGYLDVFDERSRVDFELDGASYHTGPHDRERDLRRDSALVAQGITVVRLSHNRLLREPDQVRREVLTILAEHRRIRAV